MRVVRTGLASLSLLLLLAAGSIAAEKIVVDVKRGKITISFKKGDLGTPREQGALSVLVESGPVYLMEQFVATVKKDGELLTFKARK